MVKLTIIVFLLFWQLLPGFCHQILKGSLRTVCLDQICVSDPDSMAIQNDTAKADPDQPYTPVHQLFPNVKLRAADHDAGLFTIAFCKVVR